MQFERPIGWVLEAEGRPVGYLGNISLLYRSGDSTLTAVTGSAFALNPRTVQSACVWLQLFIVKDLSIFLPYYDCQRDGREDRACFQVGSSPSRRLCNHPLVGFANISLRPCSGQKAKNQADTLAHGVACSLHLL
jgi:hypothetical protein